MSLMKRLTAGWTRSTAAACVCSGLGLAGIAGCAFNLSPGERLAASAHEDSEAKAPVTTSALSRILKRQPQAAEGDEPAVSESRSSTTVSRGRLFSALVNRFPGQNAEDRDPFLEVTDEAAEQAASSAAPRERATASGRSNAERPVAQAPKTERTDAELWKLFDDDAAVVRTGENDPALAAQDRPSSPSADDDSLPEWARPRDKRSVERAPTPQTRTASTSAAAPPVFPSKTTGDRTAASAPATDAAASVAGAARQELQSLISQARQHEQQGALRQARQSALNAATLAEREQVEFSRGEERPADVVRRLEERLAASTRDPFADAPADPAATSSPQGMSPFASGSALADSLPWTTRVQPQPAAAPAAETLVQKRTQPTPFPTAPEWRGVRANSPVSLAVVEDSASTAEIVDPSPIRHADGDEIAAPARTPGRLLPRQLPTRAPAFPNGGQELALTAPAVSGPLLAPPIDAEPIAVAPAPPLASGLDIAKLPVPAAADEELHRSSGSSGWIIGGLLLAAGLWLFTMRGKKSARRASATGAR